MIQLMSFIFFTLHVILINLSLCGSTPPLTLYPSRSAVVLAQPVKNYLKWWAIQLAIHSTACAQIDYEQLQNHGEPHTKIGIPKYYNCASKVAFLKSNIRRIYITPLVINSLGDGHTLARIETFKDRSNCKEPGVRLI